MSNEFHQDKAGFYTRGLLALAMLLGAFVLLRIAGFVTGLTEARVLAAKVDPNEQSVEDMDKLLAPAKTCAEELKKKNLFIVTPPRQNPVGSVAGILGDEVLINGRWYKVGDSVGDAKVIAIEPTMVRIVWDGQETEFSPIASAGDGGRPERSGPTRSGPRSGSAGRPQRAATGSAGPPGARLSSEERDKMRERLRNASAEERQRIREEMLQKMRSRSQ